MTIVGQPVDCRRAVFTLRANLSEVKHAVSYARGRLRSPRWRCSDIAEPT